MNNITDATAIAYSNHNRYNPYCNQNYATQEQVQQATDNINRNVQGFGLDNGNKTVDYGIRNATITMQGDKDIQQQVAYDTARINQNLCKGFSDVGLQGATNTAAIVDRASVGFSATQLQGATNTATVLQALAKDACNIEKSIDQSKFDLYGQAATLAKESIVDSTKNFYQTTLQNQLIGDAAGKERQMLAAEAAKQAAECCCELKALIIEKANATDALIKDEACKGRELAKQIQTDALRDKNAELERELLIAKLSKGDK